MPSTSRSIAAPIRRPVSKLSRVAVLCGLPVCLATALSGWSPAASAATVRVQAASASPASKSPGTNIGNAGVLTGTGSGTIVTGSDDWWVIYPATPGDTVRVTVRNNASNPSCTGISAWLDSTAGAGQTLASNSFGAGSSGDLTASAAGSDRYYVEVTPENCASSAPYTLTLDSGGGGTPPSPAVGSVIAGASIGTAWPPLHGHTSYPGAITFNGGVEKWYVLFKKPDSTVATIRVQNTTVYGATTCARIDAYLYTDLGYAGQVSSLYLPDNNAGVLSVPANQAGDPQGMFYLVITGDGSCGGSGGANYTIEPEPGAQFTSPARVPAGKSVTPAPSLGGAWPPLQGGLRYPGAITFNGGTENWYVLYKKPDSTVATIRVENRTVDGSTNCARIDAYLYSNLGYADQIGNLYLPSNNAGVLSVPARQAGDPTGVFYLMILGDGSCGGSGNASYTVELEPKIQFASPARVPARKSAASPSLGRAWPPLGGGLRWTGSVDFAGGTQNWYLLYKKPGSRVASITVANTTVDGSTSCARIDAVLYTNAGLSGQIGSLYLPSNNVGVLSVPARQAGDPMGIFYLEIAGDGSCGGTGSAVYTIEPEPGGEFSAPALKVSTGPVFKKGKVGKAYKTDIEVSEGKAPYTFIAKSKLPPGLLLDKRTGVISGTPKKRGTFSFTVQIIDSSRPEHKSVTDVFKITIT
jgi:hypothetical protein